MNSFLPHIFLGLFISTYFSLIYLNLAKKLKIFAIVNERSLHKTPIITGAGIVIGLCVLLLLFYSLYINNNTFENYFIILVFSITFIASVFGWFDDRYDIPAIKKLFFQITISGIFAFFQLVLFGKELDQTLLYFILILFLTLCAINCFNFMDGINGLAISLAIYIFSSLLILDDNIIFKYELFYITSSLLVLLLLNVKNKLFIGDAGSMALGFLIGSILINELIQKNISFITISILLAYWVSDTVCTFILRLIIGKKWYYGHRNHTYQNLARILNSHNKVFVLINVTNFLYLLPLAYFSTIYTDFSIYFFMLAYFPLIIFALKYGPILSSR